MKQRLAAGTVIALMLYATGISAQVAIPNLSDLLKEPSEPPITTIPPVFLAATGLDLVEPLVVTDEELALVGASGTGIGLAAGDPDFIVDDDLVECPDATFTTSAGINLAVAAAPPGSRIRVCPGVYSPVLIPIGKDFLTLEAPRQHGQATQCQAELIADPTKDAIVDGGSTAAIGFFVQANGVTLYGFTVQNTQGNPGIYTVPAASGYRVLSNVVQNNTFGLYLNSNGLLETLVSHNCFRLNNRPGSASGDGIYSDQGLRNARIEENFFTGHNVASIVMALNQQDITIAHNDMINDNSIALFETDNVLVQYNHMVHLGGSGVFVGGNVTGTVTFNLIEDASTGISTNALTGPNVLQIEKNHVKASRFDGIRLNNTDNTVARGNKAERNIRDGIRLQNDSDGNRIEQNLSRDNGRDGVRVDGGVQSDANTIEQNHALGNTEHDCHDDTAGAGTGGTANFWIKNIGKTENRPGLCKVKP